LSLRLLKSSVWKSSTLNRPLDPLQRDHAAEGQVIFLGGSVRDNFHAERLQQELGLRALLWFRF
jgi:hypothetical protein